MHAGTPPSNAAPAWFPAPAMPTLNYQVSPLSSMAAPPPAKPPSAAGTEGEQLAEENSAPDGAADDNSVDESGDAVMHDDHDVAEADGAQSHSFLCGNCSTCEWAHKFKKQMADCAVL